MELAVLVKGVPRSEAVRHDPDRRSIVREGVELVLNPFDQRALRVALELRRTGERVTVVSMGPPAVRPLLRETVALGADRGVHLCDPALAGSDLLATSAAIAAALRRLGPGLVLSGARSTDSDTGLLPAEVAGRLGVPVVTGARTLHREAAGAQLRADVDTPLGWTSVEFTAPAVVAVGEKIAKPLPLDPQRYDRVTADAVSTLTPAELGVPPEAVGGFGSPTSVDSVEEVAPRRGGLRIESGSAPERVATALATLGPLLERRTDASAPLPWPAARDAGPEVVVLGSGADGAVDPESLGLLTYLRRALAGHRISAAVYGPVPGPDARDRLETAGASGGYSLDPGGAPFDSGDVAGGLAGLLEHRPRLVAVVAVANGFGREVAGQLAAVRHLGAVGDAIEVRPDADGRLRWLKPSFGGGSVAGVRCRSLPVVATMPAGVARPSTASRSAVPDRWSSVPLPPALGRVRRSGERPEPFAGPEPDEADVVLALGMGVGGPEAVGPLLAVAERWRASVVGTRRVVDAGWLPARRQVGLTGRLLAPRLAVLLGVRGAPNHMVGWARADAILTVNRDREAPVFAGSDVGIVGTVDETVPALVEPVEALLREPRPPVPERGPSRPP